MSRSVSVYLLLACSLLTALFTSCSRDPNVRKQKYLDSGEKYFAEGRYREASIQYLKRHQDRLAIRSGPLRSRQSLLKLGDRSNAYQELNRTLDLAPDNYQAHADLANLLDAARKPDGSAMEDALKQAKPHLDILREKQPNSPATHEAWAKYDAALNNNADAMREMQAAIAADPNRSESYLLLAFFELRADQPDQAEANFKKAIEVDPKSMDAQMALGGFYQTRNRLPEAEQQFNHAIAMDPKSATPRAALVRLLVQENKKAEIEPFLQQTKKDLSNNPEGYRMLGDYYFANGDLDKADVEYASLYHDHPRDVQVKKNYIQILILKNLDSTKPRN